MPLIRHFFGFAYEKATFPTAGEGYNNGEILITATIINAVIYA